MEKSRRRHRLAAKARDQPVITATATDRAEAHRAAFFVLGFEGEFYLVDGACVVFEAANDGGIDADTIGSVPSGLYEQVNLIQLSESLLGFIFFKTSIPTINRCAWSGLNKRAECYDGKNICSRHIIEARPLSKITTLILSARGQKQTHTFLSEPIQLIDRAEHNQLSCGIVSEPDALHHPIEHLAVIDLHQIAATRNAQRFHRVRRHHAHLGVGRR